MAYILPITREKLQRQSKEAKEALELKMQTHTLNNIVHGVQQIVEQGKFYYINNLLVSFPSYSYDNTNTQTKNPRIVELLEILKEMYIGCDVTINEKSVLTIGWWMSS